MSWSQWVVGPNGLINGTNHVERAGIYGFDGTVWSQSNLDIKQPEIRYVFEMFRDPTDSRKNGFFMSGERFYYIKEDTETGSHGVIHGRNGAAPITIYKSTKAIVVGIGKPDAVAGKVAVAVCKIGDSLTGFGL